MVCLEISWAFYQLTRLNRFRIKVSFGCIELYVALLGFHWVLQGCYEVGSVSPLGFVFPRNQQSLHWRFAIGNRGRASISCWCRRSGWNELPGTSRRPEARACRRPGKSSRGLRLPPRKPRPRADIGGSKATLVIPSKSMHSSSFFPPKKPKKTNKS